MPYFVGVIVSYQLSAISYQLSAFSGQLFVVSRQSSVVGHLMKLKIRRKRGASKRSLF